MAYKSGRQIRITGVNIEEKKRMSRNKVRIRCNPYAKNIEYSRWNEESNEYDELSEKSKLSGSKYTKEITI